MKKLICLLSLCVTMLYGCGDGYDKIKVKDYVQKSNPDSICVNAPAVHGFSDYGFICKDAAGVITYKLFGGSDLKITSEVVLIK